VHLQLLTRARRLALALALAGKYSVIGQKRGDQRPERDQRERERAEQRESTSARWRLADFGGFGVDSILPIHHKKLRFLDEGGETQRLYLASAIRIMLPSSPRQNRRSLDVVGGGSSLSIAGSGLFLFLLFFSFSFFSLPRLGSEQKDGEEKIRNHLGSDAPPIGFSSDGLTHLLPFPNRF